MNSARELQYCPGLRAESADNPNVASLLGQGSNEEYDALVCDPAEQRHSICSYRAELACHHLLEFQDFVSRNHP